MRPLWVVAVFLVFAGLHMVASEDAEISRSFFEEYMKYKEKGKITSKFDDMLQQFSFKGSDVRAGVYAEKLGMCTVCNAVVRSVITFKQSGVDEDEIVDMIKDLCILLKIESENVCNGVVDLNRDIFMYIMDNNPNLPAERVCSLVLQDAQQSCNPKYAIEWTLEVPLGEKPEPIVKELPENDEDTLTVVQLSDVHYDPRYQVGGNAQCDEPTCCRQAQGDPASSSGAAGYWGDYRSCDLPWHALVDALDQIRKEHKNIDYIYMTGDLVDHGVWETSRDLNRGIFEQFYTEYKEKFPETPIYSSIGNHEPHPLNVYAPTSIKDEKLSTVWLYNASLSHWRNWLPEDVTSSVLTGGFYTTLARPGLRIISLNNNICYTFNWWLLDDHGTELMSEQLNWLVEVLQEAEKANEKVHILAHIPPGVSDTLNACSREFRKIIDRFENTVVAQFNGHTHNDEFHISYSLEEPERATNVALNGGSATTYANLNPNYKVYKIDAATGLVRDSETWVYNLTEANLNGQAPPKWFKLYSFQEEYGVKSLVPSELDALAHKMAKDGSLLEKYHRFYVKNSDINSGCNNGCQRNHLCQIVTDHAPDTSHCATVYQPNTNNWPDIPDIWGAGSSWWNSNFRPKFANHDNNYIQVLHNK